MVAHITANTLAQPDPLQDLLDEVLDLRERILHGTEQQLSELDTGAASKDNLSSIVNLLHYIAMRREDLRPLQGRLSNAGLSYPGPGEPHILSRLDRIIDTLSRTVSHQPCCHDAFSNHSCIDDVDHILEERSARLFDKPRNDRSSQIMVTMPTEAASDIELLKDLVARGMDVARINCAHDDESVWQDMVHNIKQAAAFHGTTCRIFMEIGGNRMRTGKVVAGKDRSGKKHRKPPRVYSGDWLVLSKKRARADMFQRVFDVPVKAVVTCTCPDVIENLRRDEHVWIDDGRICSVIRDKRRDMVLLQVDRTGPKGARIKETMGLNFPETRLSLPTFSDKDMLDLRFVSRHADMVGLSFIEQADDVLFLREQLQDQGAADLPVIARIATSHAVQNLPDIISRALAENIDLGILIARDDLAAEIGSVRFAEIQQEILWLCEAAHIPVIWATQVLETLSRKGIVSRPEITDTTLSVHAQCVLLNNGPYIEHAVSILSDVLQRMEAHRFSKFSRPGTLHW